MQLEIKVEKIYNKFKELKEESTQDCSFNKAELETQFNNTATIMKWINKKQEWNQVFRIYETQRKEQYKKLYEFYRLESDLKINTKDELSLFIESDTKYVEINNIVQLLKEILSYIDSVIENLKGKNWEITRFLDYLKFINGTK